MNLKILFVAIVLAANSEFAHSASVHCRDCSKNDNESRQPWQLLEALRSGSQIRGFNGIWISDKEFYFKGLNNSLRIYNAETKEDRIFVDGQHFKPFPGGTYTISPDSKKVLARYDAEAIFRHSIVAKYGILDIQTGTSTYIHEQNRLQYATWSPLSNKVAFVYENNVYLHDVDKASAVQLTQDGVTGIVYNGVPDWVYEEEVLGTGSALWWSPDGEKIAIGFFNDTDVNTFKYSLYGESKDPEYQYPKEVDLKYPKPGTPNPRVYLKVVDLRESEKNPVILRAPVQTVSSDHILQHVTWSSADRLLVTWLNRRQNISSLQSCDYQGSCREVTSFREPTGWIVASAPKCLADGKTCLFTNWVNDWLQIWKLDLDTGANTWPTSGNFTVLQIYGLDELSNTIFYQATLEDDPAQTHIFRDNECLSCVIKDVEEENCRQASATFSKGFTYYSLTCSGPNPAFTKIFKSSDDEVVTWESNEEFREFLSKKQRPTIKYLKVPLGGGKFTGLVKLSLPPSLHWNYWDNEQPSRKYPMIVNVYGGPNSVRVNNQFSVGFEGYLTTSREVIYALIDGRGTGNKGKNLLYTVNNHLGSVEIEDQIAVTKYLQDKYDFIDAERTGIWGWSYGGYATALTLARDSNRVFQCGISVAPVTSWLYYDTIYTERFMGLPTPEDNLENYMNSTVMSNIENFRNHDFLLIHGSGDDNVHIQQSMILAKELEKNDILFEEMTYTDEAHSISNFQPHLYHTMDHFWINCLNLDVDDD